MYIASARYVRPAPQGPQHQGAPNFQRPQFHKTIIIIRKTYQVYYGFVTNSRSDAKLKEASWDKESNENKTASEGTSKNAHQITTVRDVDGKILQTPEDKVMTGAEIVTPQFPQKINPLFNKDVVTWPGKMTEEMRDFWPHQGSEDCQNFQDEYKNSVP